MAVARRGERERQIAAAIARFAEGEASLDEAIQTKVVEAVTAGAEPAAAEPGKGELPDDLTAREAEVLGLIAGGLSDREIAECLVVSPATVKSHVNHLFAKIGARDRAQAVGYAYRHGLVAQDG